MNPGATFKEGFFWSAGAAVFAGLTYLAIKFVESHKRPAPIRVQAQVSNPQPCGCK